MSSFVRVTMRLAVWVTVKLVVRVTVRVRVKFVVPSAPLNKTLTNCLDLPNPLPYVYPLSPTLIKPSPQLIAYQI